jgi:rod shape-determining protein MreD
MDVKTIFFYFVTLFLSLLLQIGFRNLLSKFTPNFLLLTVVSISLFRGVFVGEFFGFALGLLSDTLSLNPFGSQAFLYTLVGYLVGRQNGKIDADNSVAQVVLVFLVTLFYLFGLFLLITFFSSAEKKLILFPELILNIGFAVPFFWLMKEWFNLWSPRR